MQQIVRILKTKKWIWVVLNTICMLYTTFLWMNQPRTYGEEFFFVKWLTITKRTIFNIDPKPSYKEFLFLDVSESKTVLPLTPDSSRVSIITDRKKLKNLFEFVTKNNNEVKLVFCDVLFDRSTPEDSGLEKSIVNLKDKFLGVNELIDKVVKKPVIDISTASSSIFVEDGTIIKYPILLQDSIQTVPSAMLTKLDNKMVEAFPPLVRIQDAGWSLGSPILELSVREKDFEVNSSTDSSYIKIGLGELVSLIQAFETDSVASKNLFDQYFKQKILLIGDFESDRHSTIYGDMPGTLVILNAYLTLKHGKGLLSFGLILFFIFGYGLISYTYFIDENIRIRGVALKVLEHNRGILHFFYYYGLFLTIMTIIVYYVFGLHIGIFFQLLYLKILDWFYDKKYLESWEDIKKRTKKVQVIIEKLKP
jgi:hypothetical protein